jgi:hypothetical protein
VLEPQQYTNRESVVVATGNKDHVKQMIKSPWKQVHMKNGLNDSVGVGINKKPRESDNRKSVEVGADRSPLREMNKNPWESNRGMRSHVR